MTRDFDAIPRDLDEKANMIVNAAYNVHKELGPGLLESVYEMCMCHELNKAGIPFQRQVSMPVIYDNVKLDAGLRIDILVDEKIVIELKTAEKMIPLYEAQLLTYLKVTGLRLGFLINFNVPIIKEGIKRVVI